MHTILRLSRLVLAILCLLPTCGLVTRAADEDAAPPSVPIERWLVAGPSAFPLPVFADAERGGISVDDLLGQAVLADPRSRPAEGEKLAWFDGGQIEWKPVQSGKHGVKLRRPGDGPQPAVAWLVAYLDVDRFTEFELVLTGAHPRRVWVDGEPLASGKGEGPVEGKLELATGTHVVRVKTVHDPAIEDDGLEST